MSPNTGCRWCLHTHRSRPSDASVHRACASSAYRLSPLSIKLHTKCTPCCKRMPVNGYGVSCGVFTYNFSYKVRDTPKCCAFACGIRTCRGCCHNLLGKWLHSPGRVVMDRGVNRARMILRFCIRTFSAQFAHFCTNERFAAFAASSDQTRPKRAIFLNQLGHQMTPLASAPPVLPTVTKKFLRFDQKYDF
jgi:hypothetical protein